MDYSKINNYFNKQRKDEKLDYALKQVNTIQFMRYEVDFRLIA